MNSVKYMANNVLQTNNMLQHTSIFHRVFCLGVTNFVAKKYYDQGLHMSLRGETAH